MRPQLLQVPGVADVVSYGGLVARDPRRSPIPTQMAALGVGLNDVFTALQKASANATGGYVAARLGDVRDPQPRHLRDDRRHRRGARRLPRRRARARSRTSRTVSEGYAPRQGVVTRDDNEDAVEGIVLMRRGENPSVVLEALRERIDELNEHVLPEGVKINAVLRPHRARRHHADDRVPQPGRGRDRWSSLVLFAFMLSLRASLIVALVIPLSLARVVHLPARARHERQPAVDGRGRLRHHRRRRGDPGRAPVPQALAARRRCTSRRARRSALDERIIDAANEVARPTLFSLLIIIAAYLPIFSLQRVEGRIFSPLANTVVSALRRRAARQLHARAGAVLLRAAQARACSGLAAARSGRSARLRPGARFGDEQPGRRRGDRASARCSAAAMLVPRLGSRVLARAQRRRALRHLHAARQHRRSTEGAQAHAAAQATLLKRTPEVTEVLSQLGRPEDGTDPTLPNNLEIFVKLKPLDEWRAEHPHARRPHRAR